MYKGKVRYKSRMLLYFGMLTLAVVAIVSIANYANGRRMVLKTTTDHATDSLEQLKKANDLLLENIEQTLQGITSDSDLELFGIRYSSMSSYQEKESVFARVATVLNLNSYFTACYVYYPEQQMVIDVNARSPVYEPLQQNSSSEMIRTVYRKFQEYNPQQGAPLYPVAKTSGDMEWVLAVPVRYSLLAGQAPVLLVTIDNSYFSQNLREMEPAPGAQTFIKGGEDKWLTAAPNSQLQDELSRRTENSSSGSFTQTVDGIPCLVVYTDSQMSGWQYVCAIPLDSVYRQVRFLGISAIVAAVLCAVIGLVLVHSLAGRLYTPLEVLSGRLRRGDHPDNTSEEDALAVLDVGVNALLAQNEQLQSRLQENESIVRNVFLFRLLQNGMELYESIYEQFEAYHIPFNDRMRYQVAVLSSGQDQPLRPTYEARRARWVKVLEFDQALKDAFVTQKEFHLETVNVEEDGLAIILGFEQESYTEQDMAAILASLQQDAQDRLEASVTLGFSSLSRDVEDLPVLYQQACTALQYQQFAGECRAIGFAELPRDVAEAYRYPWSIEKTILSSLRQGQCEPACRGLDEFAAYISDHIRDAEKSRMAFVHLCTDMVRTAEESMPQLADQLPADGLYKAVLKGGRSTDIVQLLKQYADALCSGVTRRREDHTNDIARAALDYLAQHYAEPQLDLDTLSAQLGFSGSYISKMFKAATGISIKEHITQKRIALACDLLRHTDKKVWEISTAVGYEQQRSFIEIFKKYKGMTPSEYRKQKEDELL